MSGGSRVGVVVVVVAWLCVAPVAGVASGVASTGSQNAGETVVTGFSAPSSVTLHRNATVQVTVNNTRDESVEQTIRVQRSRDRLWSTVATRTVTVAANTNATVAVNVSLHAGDPDTETRLRVGDLPAQSVSVDGNGAVLERPRRGDWIDDESLAPGENTTVSAAVMGVGANVGEYVVRFEGGQYETGDAYTETVTVGYSERTTVTAHPTFDAGGQHAVTGSGELLGFVNVSSPNVSITAVESLPGEVYEGGEQSLNVTVANTGSDTESFAVTTSHTPSGATTAQRADTRVVTLSPGETRTVERTVRFYERGDQTVTVNGGHAQNVSVVAPVSVVDYEVTAAAEYTDQYVNVTATLQNGRPTQASADVAFVLYNDSSGDGSEGLRGGTSLNETESVTVAGGATETATHSWLVEVPATYDAAAGDLAAEQVSVDRTPIRANLTAPAGDVALGEPVDVTLSLRNDGTATTHRHVSLWSGLTWTSRNVSLAPGASTTEAFAVTPQRRGEVEVALDQNRSVRATLSVPTPNLTVTAQRSKATPRPGEGVGLAFTLNNTGGTNESYTLPAAIEHDAFDGVAESWSISEAVAADDSETQLETWDAEQPGNYTVTVQGEQVATVTVSKPLVTENASLSNATVTAGENVTFEGTYRNPTDSRDYVWTNVPALGFVDAERAPANDTVTVTDTWQFQRAGTYDVFVNGERFAVTVEANETTESSGADDTGDDGTDDGSGSTDDTSGTTEGETDGATDSDSGTDSGGGTDTSGDGPSAGGGSSGEETTLDDATGDSSTDETATNDTLTNETTATTTNGTATNETTGTTTTGNSSTTTATTAASTTTAATGAGTGTAAANATSDEAAANATTGEAATTGGTESSTETEQRAPTSSSADTPGFGAAAAVVALFAAVALRARSE